MNNFEPYFRFFINLKKKFQKQKQILSFIETIFNLFFPSFLSLKTINIFNFQMYTPVFHSKNCFSTFFGMDYFWYYGLVFDIQLWSSGLMRTSSLPSVLRAFLNLKHDLSLRLLHCIVVDFILFFFFIMVF